MAHIAFDLDETLGRFSTPAMHLIITDLTMYYAGQGRGYEPFKPSEDLKKKMDAALTAFAECLASDEVGKQLLRPGIEKIIKKVSDAKDAGQVQNIVVYSNNGNLNCLKLATRMIEFLLKKPGIFCDHINFYNPLRSFGDNPDYSNPGNANKTWRVYRLLFTQKCRETVAAKPENSYFFDDVIHNDIYRKIGGSNYFNVNPYKKDIPLDIVNKCFETAIKSQGLDTNEEYFRYAKPLLGNSPPTLQGLLNIVEQANRGFRLVNFPFSDDTDSILERLEKIFPAPITPTINTSQANTSRVNTSRVNTMTTAVPFNVGTSVNTSAQTVPFFGGKRRSKHSKRHSSRKHKKLRKGTRKN